MKAKVVFQMCVWMVTFSILVACSVNKTENAEQSAEHDSHEHASSNGEVADATAPQFQVDAAFQNQLASVFNAYAELKDAFVASNVTVVKQKASATLSSLSAVDMKLVTGAAHNDWMAYLSPMKSALKEIASSDDLEAQRRSFSTVSDNLYKSAKAFGLGGTTAYYEYCPMAFNNEGAYWLSKQDEIRNPYFGDRMLTCGEVKEKLK